MTCRFATTSLLATAFASALSAQQITITADRVAAAQLVTIVGTTTTTESLAAGPIAGQSFQLLDSSPLVEARAAVDWVVGSSAQDDAVYFGYGITTSNNAPSAVAAVVEVHEILVTLQAPTPRLVQVLGNIAGSATAGAPAPLFEMDFGDDGTFDVSSSGFGAVPNLLSVGPTPIAIRLRCSATASGAGTSNAWANVQLEFRPDNGLAIEQVISGCTDQFQVTPQFSHDGVLLWTQGSAAFGSWAVLGLGVQPIVLPALIPACVLLPAPELIVLLPPAPAGVALPIPAAARPITIYAQGIYVHSPSNILAGRGFRIDA